MNDAAGGYPSAVLSCSQSRVTIGNFGLTPEEANIALDPLDTPISSSSIESRDEVREVVQARRRRD
jgi:hypothetical protein